MAGALPLKMGQANVSKTRTMNEENPLDRIEELAQEYFALRRSGESISVAGFADQHPLIREELIDFIEAEQLLSDLKQTEHKAEKKAKAKQGRIQLPTIPDYKIIRELGRGAMGVVYEAEQVSLARRVALKTTLFATSGDRTQRLRFEHEARTAGRLHHPNIVPIYDVGEADDSLYYAMQFIDGCGLDRVARASANILRTPGADQNSMEASLAGWLIAGDSKQDSSGTIRIKKDGSTVSNPTDASSTNTPSTNTPTTSSSTSRIFSLRSDPSTLHKRSRYHNYYRSIAKIGHHVADALAFAHNSGVIHRDIKPANLLLDSKGDVWVADFGLVKTEDHELTQTGAFVGTLRFMAPERFQGKCDARSDVYSLGVTLYELLALRPVYDSTDQLTLLNRIRDVDPPPLRSVTRSIPRDLDVIVARAMHKDPRHRYASARDLADDLQCFLDGRPIRARQVGTTEKLLLWAKKHKALAVSLATILTLLVVGSIAGGVATVYFRNQGIKQTDLANQNKELAAQKTAETEEATRQRDSARQNAYFADMQSANQSWQDGQVAQMLTTLRRYMPTDDEQSDQEDLRGWEWYNLMALAGACRQTIFEDEPAKQLKWTADGRLVSSSSDTLYIRDAEGKVLHQIRIPGIRRFAVSPNGDRVVTIANDSILSIWEAGTGKLAQKINTEIESIADVDWDQQGNRISFASHDDARLQIVNLSTGKIGSYFGRIGGLGHARHRVKFSPDGKYLAVCDRAYRAHILDIENRTWVERTESSHNQTVCVAWHPDSRRFVEAADGNGLSLFEIVEPSESSVNTKPTHDREIAHFHVDGAMTDASFSDDGAYLMACSRSHRVDIYDIKSKNLRWSFRGHLGPTVSADWHESKPQGVSASSDGTIKFWEIPSTDLYVRRKQMKAEIYNSSGVSRDGRWKWQRVIEKVASKTFKWTIEVTNTKTGEKVATMEMPDRASNDWIYTPIFSSDERMFATFSYPLFPNAQSLQRNTINDSIGTVHVWDLNSSKQVDSLQPSTTCTGHPNFALHENLFVTSAEPGVLRIFDLDKNTDKRIRAHRDRMCLRLSPDGSRLATCSNGKITIWDTSTWKEIASYFGHDSKSTFDSVMWGDNGRYLVTASSDGSAIIWDTTSHTRLHTLSGHQSRIRIVAFSDDQTRLLTSDENIHVWHVATGREIYAYPMGLRVQDEYHATNERMLKMANPASQFEFLDRVAANAQRQSSSKSEQPSRIDDLARDLVDPKKPAYDPGQALELARRAIELEPSSTRYRTTLAWAQFRTGDFSAARETLQQIESNTESASPEPFLLLTLCELKTGNKEAARNAYKSAISAMTPANMHDELRETGLEVARLMLQDSDSKNGRTVVTTLEDEIDGMDDGSVSLREAILISQPGDRIEFAVEGEIRLWIGAIRIQHDLEIVGPGHEKLTLSGLGKSRIFEIDDGDQSALSHVAIVNLRLTNGNVQQRIDFGQAPREYQQLEGGAIRSTEDLTIRHAAFEDNGVIVWKGGAIWSGPGTTVRVENSTFARNSAEEAGAIYLEETAQVTIDSCTFESHESVAYGALHLAGVSEIQNCTFSKNESKQGGTVFYRGHDLAVTHSTIQNNTIGSDGAIVFESEELATEVSTETTPNRIRITNSTITGNQTTKGKTLDLHLPENGLAAVTLSNNVIGVLVGAAAVE